MKRRRSGKKEPFLGNILTSTRLSHVASSATKLAVCAFRCNTMTFLRGNKNRVCSKCFRAPRKLRGRGAPWIRSMMTGSYEEVEETLSQTWQDVTKFKGYILWKEFFSRATGFVRSLSSKSIRSPHMAPPSHLMYPHPVTSVDPHIGQPLLQRFLEKADRLEIHYASLLSDLSNMVGSMSRRLSQAS